MISMSTPRADEWSEILSYLKDCGWKQSEIAKAVECSQGYVSQLMSGIKKNPSHRIGSLILSIDSRRNYPGPPSGTVAASPSRITARSGGREPRIQSSPPR